MIEVKNLSKSYSTTEVLNVEELYIPKGETFGLVGNNGAGKTTLFSLLLDLIKASSGHVILQDIDVAKSEDWKFYTGSYIDESFLIGYLTPDEYFRFIGKLRGMNQEDISLFLKQFEEFFRDEVLGVKKYLRDLSKGNQKKVGIVAALMGNPEVIVLDEPFANLDPTTQFRLRKILEEFSKERETTFLISSHDLNHVAEVCDRIVVLEKGRVVKDMMKTEATLQELEDYFSVE